MSEIRIVENAEEFRIHIFEREKGASPFEAMIQIRQGDRIVTGAVPLEDQMVVDEHKRICECLNAFDGVG